MAEPVFLQEHKIRGKPESDGKFSESPNKVHIGTTCSKLLYSCTYLITSLLYIPDLKQLPT